MCKTFQYFRIIQHIQEFAHDKSHLLDYIISSKSDNFVSITHVSDFVSDHRALHGKLECTRGN